MLVIQNVERCSLGSDSCESMCATSLARELAKVKLEQVCSLRNHWICFEEARATGYREGAIEKDMVASSGNSRSKFLLNRAMISPP
jgi:hypothetical protein